MFWIKKEEDGLPQFHSIKVGFKGVYTCIYIMYFIWICCPGEKAMTMCLLLLSHHLNQPAFCSTRAALSTPTKVQQSQQLNIKGWISNP